VVIKRAHLFWLGVTAALYTVAVAVSNLLIPIFIDLGPFGRTPIFLMIGLAAVVNVIVAAALETPGRFLIASFGAILLSETVDTEIYHRMRSRSWLMRVFSSNAISVPLDSIAFTVVAFAGEPGYDALVMAQIVQADLLFKFGIGALVALGKNWWDRA
jgi:hypothetical protein